MPGDAFEIPSLSPGQLLIVLSPHSRLSAEDPEEDGELEGLTYVSRGNIIQIEPVKQGVGQAAKVTERHRVWYALHRGGKDYDGSRCFVGPGGW